jgi:hypothetical protein
MPAPRKAALVPAVRPDLSLTDAEADLSSAAVDAFTVAIGGRQALLDALVVASGSPDVDRVTNLLVDPRYGGWTLRRICALAGLTVADLFRAYQKALVVRAHLQATRIVTSQLTAVVDDIMRRAQPHEDTCEACDGTGSFTPEPTKKVPNPEPKPCFTCRGKGIVSRKPDLDRQKVALELGQLIQRQGGINIAQNNLTLPAGTSSPTAPGALEQLQQAVHETLYPRARPLPAATAPPSESPIEAEVLSDEGDPCPERSPEPPESSELPPCA